MKNQYRIDGDIVYISLKTRKGDQYETKINIWHLDRILELNLSWHLCYNLHTKSYYCKATEYLGLKDGKPNYKTIYLHNTVKTVIKEGYVKHHKNHDTLDNTDDNLEEVPSKKNSVYRNSANRNTSTGVRNVCWSKTENKYIVQLQVNGKTTVFGRFDNLEEAKICAEENREIIYGTK